MSDLTGKKLSETVLAKMTEFRNVCEGLDEETSSRTPVGRWSPKQIVSHLCGPDGTGSLPGLKAFVEQDIPLIDMEAENPYWSDRRSRMTLSELLAEFAREYSSIASFVEGLSAEQLSRKARIPMLRETELGEYPTLAQWVYGLSGYHIGFHIDHMREILQALGVPGKKT